MGNEKVFRKFLCLSINFFILARNEGSLAKSSGHEIWNYLFLNSSYNNEVRPVKQWNTTTNVTFRADIVAVFDFSEVKQTIVITSKLLLVWVDEFLVWNPYHFGNVTHIHVPQSRIWKPYIFLENSVSKQTEIGTPSLQVIVSYDGIIQWNPAEVFKFTCAVDLRKFPFDTQKCTMVFEAVGYTRAELRILSDKHNIHFHGSGIISGWTIEETDMETVDNHGADVHILCTIKLRRNPTYFILNMFLPIIILSFMNICVFILPVKSGEKAGFAITVFLSLAVFLTIVSSNLPENSDKVSLLNVYVFTCTFLSVVIATVTIVQIKLYHLETSRQISPCFAKLSTFLISKSTHNNTSKCNETRLHKNTLFVEALQSEGACAQKKSDVVEIVSDKTVVTWQDFVQALDNFFLIVFLFINFITTSFIFTLAFRNEDIVEEEQTHGH